MKSPAVPADRGTVAVIGGGPAGLMAAQMLADAGIAVDLYDAMPSVGRKFLLAGKGGLNLTHSEAFERFVARYAERSSALRPLLQAFGPAELRAWVEGLGVPTFVGSSGRVFPKDMKAAPLLRAWLHQLRGQGAQLHMRHRWAGWSEAGELRFQAPHGEQLVRPAATVLALGGASWRRLGSDGAWWPLLQQRGVALAPLRPSNCGFNLAWSEHLSGHFAGAPLKSVALSFEGRRQLGECVLTATGLEGSLVYAFSAALREAITQHGHAPFELDLLPSRTLAEVTAEVAHPRGSRSWSSHLKSRLGLEGVKAALLWEVLPREPAPAPAQLAALLKALPLRALAPRPLDEAISTAGGVRFEALDEGLMLQAMPGVFCCGEMLDWEAPTGGYLLTACFATGRKAGQGVQQWLARAQARTLPANASGAGRCGAGGP